MSDVKLFRITNGGAEELVGQPVIQRSLDET